MSKEDKGLRDNKGKPRIDLSPADAMMHVGKVLAMGAEKYTIKFENKWEKILSVQDVSSLHLIIAEECVVDVMKNSSGKIILNMLNGKGKTVDYGKGKIVKEKESWIRLGEETQKREQEIKKLSGSGFYSNMDSLKNLIKPYVKKDVLYVGKPNICTLITTIKQGNLEVSCVVSAITVLECLEMIERELQEHYNIYLSDIKHNGEHNWEKGMAYSKIVSSLERHLTKWKMGEDLDDESGLHHIDHVLCNALFLSRHVHAFPEKDDRYIPFIMNHKRVGLDVDGVLADFSSAFSKRMGLVDRGNPSWYMSYKAKDPDLWAELLEDKDFWMGLKPLVDPNSLCFEPVAYVTARSIPVSWTEEWLEYNGFPCNEVVAISANGGEHDPKVEAIKDRDIDIFIDDHYKNFIELNQAGVKCFLQDSYHNKRYPVGSLRIKHPNDVLTYF